MKQFNSRQVMTGSFYEAELPIDRSEAVWSIDQALDHNARIHTLQEPEAGASQVQIWPWRYEHFSPPVMTESTTILGEALNQQYPNGIWEAHEYPTCDARPLPSILAFPRSQPASPRVGGTKVRFPSPLSRARDRFLETTKTRETKFATTNEKEMK
jgi:hypothetical protein